MKNLSERVNMYLAIIWGYVMILTMKHNSGEVV